MSVTAYKTLHQHVNLCGHNDNIMTYYHHSDASCIYRPFTNLSTLSSFLPNTLHNFREVIEQPCCRYFSLQCDMKVVFVLKQMKQLKNIDIESRSSQQISYILLPPGDLNPNFRTLANPPPGAPRIADPFVDKGGGNSRSICESR